MRVGIGFAFCLNVSATPAPQLPLALQASVVDSSGGEVSFEVVLPGGREGAGSGGWGGREGRGKENK